jgi:hypothetical protein
LAISVISAITDTGRFQMAEAIRIGRSFVVNKFSVSDAGHSLVDPNTALAPDPTVTTIPVRTFSYTDRPINASVLVSAFCPQFTCVVAPGEGNGPISTLALIATVLFSPVLDDPDVGKSFLFALGNFPLRVKVPQDSWTFNALVQL